MSLSRSSPRIVIAGASSLLGAELRQLLEEGRFAAADFRLVDEELAAGILTEAGGEPAVIQPVEEDSFSRAQCVFFTGSADFTRRNAAGAQRSGAKVIDLSGGLLEEKGTTVWFPQLETLRGAAARPEDSVFCVPSAPGTIAALLSLALQRAGLRRLMLLFFRPVSEAGRPGIEELENQTTQLLSFQPAGHPVFGTQVAFNLLERYGEESAQNLEAERARVRRETAACLGGAGIVPSLQVLHAPVFYGYTFAACADLAPEATAEGIAGACREAGFVLAEPGEAAPSNLTTGDTGIHVGYPEGDPALRGAWWLWGAADNVKLPASNAVRLAERLL